MLPTNPRVNEEWPLFFLSFSYFTVFQEIKHIFPASIAWWKQRILTTCFISFIKLLFSVLTKRKKIYEVHTVNSYNLETAILSKWFYKIFWNFINLFWLIILPSCTLLEITQDPIFLLVKECQVVRKDPLEGFNLVRLLYEWLLRSVARRGVGICNREAPHFLPLCLCLLVYHRKSEKIRNVLLALDTLILFQMTFDYFTVLPL